MTHILVTSGSPTGGPIPRTLSLGVFQNVSTFPPVTLTYITAGTLTLTDRHTNVSTFFNVTLESRVVQTLTLGAAFQNVSTFPALTLANLPFVAVNAETTALLAACTYSYNTTQKIQIDTLITNLKSAGVWADLDWYYGGNFMGNVHDSLLDWTNPTRSLVVVGTPTFLPFVGWQGMPSFNNSKLKSGWQPTDGPHSSLASFTLFIRIVAMSGENNNQAAGNWSRSAGPGPTAPVGTFITVMGADNDWDAGANVNAFDGITGAALGAGVPATLAIVKNGATQEAFRNGASAGTDTTATSANRTSPEGLCILGSADGTGAGRAFNGLLAYGGWGAALTGGELAAIDAAVTNALLPPAAGPTTTDALFTDDANNWLVVDDAGNYLQVQ